jgi:hypothetical protein
VFSVYGDTKQTPTEPLRYAIPAVLPYASPYLNLQFMYMHNAQRSPLGFEGHAMLLSLPPVLLMWAIIAFSAAIIAYALQSINSLNGIAGAPAWVILGVFVLILVFVAMGLHTFSNIWKFQSPVSRFGLSQWIRGNSRQKRATKPSVLAVP